MSKIAKAGEDFVSLEVNDARDQISGLLDDDGQFNPNPEQLSREHPDYDPDEDPRNQRSDKARDERGRFSKQEQNTDDVDDESTDVDEEVDRDDTDDVDDTDTADVTDDRSEADEAGDDDEGTDDIQTLSELAEALEFDEADFKESLQHTFNAAGEQVTVTLAELEAGYQKDADYRRSTAKLADERRDLETDFEQRNQTIQQQQMLAANALNVMDQMFAQELNSQKLADLRDLDTPEWTAQRDEIGQKRQAIAMLSQQAAASYADQQQAIQNAYIERENKTVMEKIPDFGEQHRTRIVGTLSGLGFTQDEIPKVHDSRLILGALKLADLEAKVAQYEKMEAKAKASVKRVKKSVPKMTKPGKRQSSNKPRVDKGNLAKARHRLRKSGSTRDAAGIIENMI